MPLLSESAAPLAQLPLEPISEGFSQPKATCLIQAAHNLLNHLSRGHAPQSAHLRSAMEQAFGASDATGAWVWKDAYEALEIAQVLFLRRFLPAMRKSAKSPHDLLTMLTKLGDLIPTQTRRSEDSIGLQQYSTPLELAHPVA